MSYGLSFFIFSHATVHEVFEVSDTWLFKAGYQNVLFFHSLHCKLLFQISMQTTHFLLESLFIFYIFLFAKSLLGRFLDTLLITRQI